MVFETPKEYKADEFEKFEGLEYKEEKKKYDPLISFLREKSIDGSEFIFSYKVAEEIKIDPEDSSKQTASVKEFTNYHDFLKFQKSLSEAERKELIGTLWKDWRGIEWTSPGVFAGGDFWKRLDDENDILYKHRDEIIEIINKIKSEKFEDEYAKAVEKGEVKEITIKEKPEEKEKISEDDDLSQARNDYANVYNEYIKDFGKIKNKEKAFAFEKTLELARGKIVMGDKESKKNFINFFVATKEISISEEQAEEIYNVELKKAEYEKTKEDLGKKMFAEGVKPAEIFKKLILEERENLNNAKIESWPPVKKSAWKKGLEWWMKQKPAVRLLISTAIVTGAVAGSGGFAAVGVGGAALFAGQRYTKGFLSVGVGQLAGKGVDWVMSKGINTRREGALEKLKKGFTLEKLKEVEKEYQKILEESARAERKKLYVKAGVMIAAGAGMAISLGMLENAYTGGVKPSVPEAQIKPSPAVPETGVSAKPPVSPIAEAPTEVPPETPTASEIKPFVLEIKGRGPEGAIIDHFRGNPESAKVFGWNGKADLSEWAGAKAHNLWLEDAKEALAKPETIKQLEELGYSPDADGYAEMMRRIGKGAVELDIKTGEINLVDADYLKARVSLEVAAPEAPSEIAPEIPSKIMPEETWKKALGVEHVPEIAEIGRGAITKTLYENFGMGADLYDKFSGMKLREFLALETGSGMPFTSDLPWEGYNYVQIGDLQKAMRQYYFGLSSLEQISVNKAPVGEFIKQNFDKLFPQK